METVSPWLIFMPIIVLIALLAWANLARPSKDLMEELPDEVLQAEVDMAAGFCESQSPYFDEQARRLDVRQSIDEELVGDSQAA